MIQQFIPPKHVEYCFFKFRLKVTVDSSSGNITVGDDFENICNFFTVLLDTFVKCDKVSEDWGKKMGKELLLLLLQHFLDRFIKVYISF